MTAAGAAITTGILCARPLLGDGADFRVADFAAPALAWLPMFAVFGLMTGLLGVGYNALVLWFLDHVSSVRRVDPAGKAATIGALIGAVLVVLPLAVGGGDSLTQSILAGHGHL